MAVSFLPCKAAALLLLNGLLMVGVAQSVEPLVVAQVVVGSSPITHPILTLRHAPVAQLDRAPDFESVGRRFESCRACHKIKGLAIYWLPLFSLVGWVV